MDKMSIWAILFVSVPEEFLVVITTMLAAGYKQILDFRDKRTVFKILLATILMVAFADTTRAFLPYVYMIGIILLFLFYIIICIVFRYRPLSCIWGLILALAINVLGETAGMLSVNLLGFAYSEILENDFIRLAMTIPVRILQLFAIIVIMRIRNINFSTLKISFFEWVSLVSFLLILFLNIILIEKLKIYDLRIKFVLLIGIGLSFWLLYNIFFLKKKEYMREKQHEIEIQSIKKMLSEGKVEQVKELIELGTYTNNRMK